MSADSARSRSSASSSAAFERAGLVETVLGRVGLADEGQRDEDDAGDGEHGPDRERERGHARAAAQLVVARGEAPLLARAGPESDERSEQEHEA